MGGNNPLVIGEVSHIDAAVYQTALSAYMTAGQRCTCARRVIIPDGPMGDHFLEKFIQISRNLQIAPYWSDPEPFMGTVISNSEALKHLSAQDKLVQLGGAVQLKMDLLEKRTAFLSPGIIDMTSVKNRPDEEIFAPLVQIIRYRSFEEAIQIANQTQYGLAAGLFSNNSEQYQHFYQHIRAGLINWNRPTTGASSKLPFGGVGRSGNHRPSAYFAADYCAYPIASMETSDLSLPEKRLPGI